MDNKELLGTLCNALEISDANLTEIIQLSGHTLVEGELATCSDLVVRMFLEGLIVSERGPREDGAAIVLEDAALTNNQILKKLRIALNLQELDMLAIFEEGEVELSASEFGALFRKENNKHYRPCSDELLQRFLAGLTPSLDV
jgi:uncharacterized protein YehS (DUF1456 family)